MFTLSTVLVLVRKILADCRVRKVVRALVLALVRFLIRLAVAHVLGIPSGPGGRRSRPGRPIAPAPTF